MNVKGKPLFYFDGSLNGIVTLSEEESRHGALSLRLKEKDSVVLTNGKGEFAEATCLRLHPKFVQVEVIKSEIITPSRIYRRLCVAPPKTAERLDWMIEKSIEIGVNEIWLLETQNSERNKLNLERLQKIAVATIKQSKQAFLPEIKGLIKWKHLIESDFKGKKFIAHVSENLIVLKENVNKKDKEMTILIGPEGDFTQEEVDTAVKMGYKEVSLGPNVLRTETAALYTLTIFNAFM